MTDIITMGETLYVFASTRFVPFTANTMAPASNFNVQNRTTGPSFECWQVDLTFRPRQGDDLDDLEQFIMKLRGGKVLTRLYDRSRAANTTKGYTQPRGAGASTSTINLNADAAAGAESITLRGLTASQTISLKTMDHLGIGENLHAVMDTAPSDSGGLATVSIWPPLRMGAADGDPVSLVKPTGLFRVTGGTTDLAKHGRALISEELTLSFIEEPAFS